MGEINLRGVFPPIPTPFDEAGELALDRLVENIERWNKYDLSGYVVLGSNGEAVLVSQDEKVAVWEAAREAIPVNKLMIAGAGCQSTRETVVLSCKAAEAGADAVLLVTPDYYDGQMTSAALLQHFTLVADSVPVPVLLYSVPKFTHVDIDAVTVAQLAEHPNIIGIKDTGGSVAKMADIVRLANPEFQLLAGSASFLLGGLVVGAVGGILALANISPVNCLGIYHLYRAGRIEEAADLQRRMVPVNAAITARWGIPGLKVAMEMLGYYGGPVRSPLLGLTEEARLALRDILIAGGLLSEDDQEENP
jgi:4-hydroxy-2-oxoglutarate aldolase